LSLGGLVLFCIFFDFFEHTQTLTNIFTDETGRVMSPKGHVYVFHSTFIGMKSGSRIMNDKILNYKVLMKNYTHEIR